MSNLLRLSSKRWLTLIVIIINVIIASISTSHSLCARLFAKHFTKLSPVLGTGYLAHTIPFNPQNNPRDQACIRFSNMLQKINKSNSSNKIKMLFFLL